MVRTKLSDRVLPRYSLGEEIINSASHGIGALLGAAATVLCIIAAVRHSGGIGIVSASIYGASLVILYSMSTLYHSLSPHCYGKRVMQILDHCSIYLLIAGTYTPIALVAVRNQSQIIGWVLFSVVWAVAALGITLTAIDLNTFKKFSMVCYLALGWCVVLTLPQVLASIGLTGFGFLLGGGIAYTLGSILYGLGKRRKYFHSVFHIFVLLGSVLHFFCILLYVL